MRSTPIWGFVLRTRDRATWPFDANQLYYLIEQGWIKDPILSSDSYQITLKESEIDDRNKQNTLVRVISISQIVWFLISCIARACQGLAVTTIGFVATTVAVTIFWFQKPADIRTQQIIELEVSVPDILVKAGLSNTYYSYVTPLDFLDQEKTYFGVAWNCCLNILYAILTLRKMPPRPINRRPDDNFPPVSHAGLLIVAIPGLLSWGANLAAWNFDFPTTFEKDMWRVCSIVLCTTVALGFIYQEIIFVFFPEWRKQACD